MAIRGAKPKPSAIKRVTGNPGRRRLNEAEPQPTGRPSPPTPLSGRPLALWDAHVAPSWWLTAADSPTAFMWCLMFAEFEASGGDMLAARISQLRALGSALGFDPASRARLDTPPDRSNSDPAEGYF